MYTELNTQSREIRCGQTYAQVRTQLRIIIGKLRKTGSKNSQNNEAQKVQNVVC